MTAPASVAEVVANGLCIGCGLCESVTGGRVSMAMTERGTLRPSPVAAIGPEEERAILAACPGAVSESFGEDGVAVDPLWGPTVSMRYAWAADPDVRFRSATGGVLTALAMHVVASGEAAFVLHVAADPERPMRSRWVMSETPADVLAACGSRYGPTAPLAGLGTAIERDEPFAVVGKPCDIGAVARYARVDGRLAERCVARLTLVCGGQSRLGKSHEVLDRFGIDESAVTLFRYRGHGNPGPTRVEAEPDRVHELTYLDMWADESSWDLESRCTLCPDALGEAADVAAADVWPGGTPTGEDEGVNGIVVRTGTGRRLVEDAVASGALVLGDPIDARDLDGFQPHQVRKKVALAVRHETFAAAGRPVIETIGLRIDELGERLPDAERTREQAGTHRRIDAGRYTEPVVS